MHLDSASRRRSGGFTLIELMITVGIVAILAGIAYPSYTDYLRRGRVQEAPTNLSDFRTRMEQFYQDNRVYTATDGSCGVALPTNKTFNYACNAPTNQTYTATATGTGLAAGLVYSVNQRNDQTTTCSSCAWNFSGTQTTWVLRKP